MYVKESLKVHEHFHVDLLSHLGHCASPFDNSILYKLITFQSLTLALSITLPCKPTSSCLIHCYQESHFMCFNNLHVFLTIIFPSTYFRCAIDKSLLLSPNGRI